MKLQSPKVLHSNTNVEKKMEEVQRGWRGTEIKQRTLFKEQIWRDIVKLQTTEKPLFSKILGLILSIQ